MIELYILGSLGVAAAAGVSYSALKVIWKRVVRPKLKGQKGESKVNRILQKFAKKHGHSKDDILIPGSRGTSQIDHLLITKRGIFVIETKNYSGIVMGGEHDQKWQQTFPGSNRSPREFLNPILQNKSHVRAVQNLLGNRKDIPIHSLVVFGNGCVFPDVPGVIGINQLKSALNSYQSGPPILSDKGFDAIVKTIEQHEIKDHSSRAHHNISASISVKAARASKEELDSFLNISQSNSTYVEPVQRTQEPDKSIPKEKMDLMDTHAKLTIKGRTDTINGFFESAKRKEDGSSIMQGGNFDYFVCPYTEDKFPVSEAINLYQGLWINYLNNRPDLVEYMKQNGTEYLGNSFRCNKALNLYNTDKDGFIRKVKDTAWYQNMLQKLRSNSLKNKVSSAEYRRQTYASSAQSFKKEAEHSL